MKEEKEKRGEKRKEGGKNTRTLLSTALTFAFLRNNALALFCLSCSHATYKGV